MPFYFSILYCSDTKKKKGDLNMEKFAQYSKHLMLYIKMLK